MLPVSWLRPRSRVSRFVRALRDGMVPVSWLNRSWRCFRFVRPLGSGTPPVRCVLPRDRFSSVGREPRDGMGPVRLLLYRSSPVTCAEDPSQVTPNQLHSVPAAPFHPVDVVQPAPFVPL